MNLKPFNVVYFVDLHLDTLSLRGPHAHKAKHWCYAVDGKPRPMLILAMASRERGRQWFRVLPITSKGRAENGSVKEGMISIGAVLDGERESFVRLEPRLLPENLIHCGDFSSAVVEPRDRLGFQAAIRVIEHRARQGKIAREL